MSNTTFIYFILTTYSVNGPLLGHSTKLRTMRNAVQNSIALHLFLICVNILVLEQVFEIAAHIRYRVVTLHNLKL
jgi:hypothetical protein